jgi:cell pole-organizing protein PopZ
MASTAADTPDKTQAAAGQADIDDIMSSIRTGVEEGGSKVGEHDLLEAAAQSDGPEDPTALPEAPAAEDDDILELSADEMVPEAEASSTPATEDDAVVDLAAFGSSGETTMVAAPAATPLDAEPVAAALQPQAEAAPAPAADAPVEASADASADDFDKLLADMAAQKEIQAAEVERKKQELLAEEEPLGAEALATVLAVDSADTSEEPADDAEPEQADDETPAEAPAAPSFKLDMVDVGAGPQVAFPAEVLAMALRPMVQQWLADNLPSVVEKLMKEEIAKMTQS